MMRFYFSTTVDLRGFGAIYKSLLESRSTLLQLVMRKVAWFTVLSGGELSAETTVLNLTFCSVTDPVGYAGSSCFNGDIRDVSTGCCRSKAMSTKLLTPAMKVSCCLVSSYLQV